MWYVLEIIIIILAGLASIAFLARYFFISSRPKKHCGCSVGCSAVNKEIYSKILKANHNAIISKDNPNAKIYDDNKKNNKKE